MDGPQRVGEGGDMLINHNAAESDVSRRSHPINYSANLKTEQPSRTDALEDLYDLLEEYAPAWYTEEHRERAQAALRSVKKS